MIALHHSIMGSSQPPTDQSLPFGYVGLGQELYADPPEPAPGAPLLSEQDEKTLSEWFESFTDLSPNGDLTHPPYDLPSYGEGLNEAWMGLPPQFVGSATSYGHYPSPMPQPHLSPEQHRFPTHQFAAPDLISTPTSTHAPHLSMSSHPHLLHHQQQQQQQQPPPPPPQQQQQHEHSHLSHTPMETVSPDVVAAATLLHQHGSAQRHNQPSQQQQIFYSPQSSHHTTLPMAVAHVRHQALDEFQQEARMSASLLPVGDESEQLARFIFGPSANSHTRHHIPANLQWGSDVAFSPHINTYMPTSDTESFEVAESDKLKVMSAFALNQPLNITGVSSSFGSLSSSDSRSSASPVDGGYLSPQEKTHGRKASDMIEGDHDAEEPAKKRRKSKIVKEPVGKIAAKKIKTTRANSVRKMSVDSGTPAPTTAVAAATGKRRKSTANNGKPPRENLTEEQKRENHIRSEQKRRTQIKEGFDGLCELIPELRSGGYSKSTMLLMSVEWLDNVLRQNNELEELLAAVGGPM